MNRDDDRMANPLHNTMSMKPVYITSVGAFLPNQPVPNDDIEKILGLVGGKPSRLKDRILKQNGIRTRYYALDHDGRTTHLNEELAANAIKDALARRGMRVDELEMLAAGTTQGDVPVPGFASMVHGRVGGAPAEILSAAGVCCASMQAFAGAVRAVQTGAHRNAAVVGSELVSRCLKASRFESEATLEDNKEIGYRAFDADFLRWMLSDGAGAVILENKPAHTGLSLRVEWVELVSYANERPVCMYTGMMDKDNPKAGNTWLDYPFIGAADRTGMMKIRQDTKLLPDIVKLGVEEYLRLLKRERLRAEEIDHVLCHYSSHFFKGEIMQLLEKAGVAIPEEKWFSNLYTRGNTGAASIFLMLEEAMTSGRFKKGDTIVLMVPESGRFTVSFAKLKVVDASDGVVAVAGAGPAQHDAVAGAGPAQHDAVAGAGPAQHDAVAGAGPAQHDAVAGAGPARQKEAAPRRLASTVDKRDRSVNVESAIAESPLGEFDQANAIERYLGIELALVWADFERMLREVPIVKRLNDGTATLEDYKRLLVNLRQQVMEGARWIARAASNVSIELFPLRSMFIEHAGDEHRDYQMLERDYVAVGGTLEEIQRQPKNIGSEALSSFMFHHASQPDPLDLIGAMFVIEGLGTKKANRWAEQLKEQLGLETRQVSFLAYHGKNDDNHFDKLRDVIRSGVLDQKMAERVVKTAKVTARLYALQLEEIDHV